MDRVKYLFMNSEKGGWRGTIRFVLWGNFEYSFGYEELRENYVFFWLVLG